MFESVGNSRSKSKKAPLVLHPPDQGWDNWLWDCPMPTVGRPLEDIASTKRLIYHADSALQRIKLHFSCSQFCRHNFSPLWFHWLKNLVERGQPWHQPWYPAKQTLPSEACNCYQIAFSENCRIHFSKLEIIRCPWWKYTLRQWPGRLPHSKLSFAQAAPAHFLTHHPLSGGNPKSATFANIKGWGSTNSPLHPRPLSNIKLVNKAFTSQFACAESLNFELFVAFF